MYLPNLTSGKVLPADAHEVDLANLLRGRENAKQQAEGERRRNWHEATLLQLGRISGKELLYRSLRRNAPLHCDDQFDSCGADIEVDGAFLGNTPAEVPLVVGERSVRLTKNGYKPWERKLHVLSGGKQIISAELEQLSP